MPQIPRDPLPDSSLALLADPYGYIGSRCRRFQSDVFETRLMLRRTLCMTGPEAAEVFYDTTLFQRQGAAPEPLSATLLGKGAVQGLDGAAHAARKAYFVGLLDAKAVGRLAATVREAWRARAESWRPGSNIVLYRAAQQVLAQAVCHWAGMPAQVSARSADWLVPMFDDAARGLVPHLRARAVRKQAERRVEAVVRAVRLGRYTAPAGSALARIATHREADGSRLDDHLAAVELLNVLRPVVAVSVYVTFAAHAMHVYPQSADFLAPGDRRSLRAFLEEVRRFYPFFPAVAAQVRRAFTWRGIRFPRGRRVLFDLYGTCHDVRAWTAPQRFDPARFLDHVPNPYAMVPQGGATATGNHRCPGEDTALAVMAASIEFLTQDLDYTLPPQRLDIDRQRIPALPRDGMVLTVRALR